MPELKKIETNPSLAKTLVYSFVNHYPDYNYISSLTTLLKKYGYDPDPFYWMDPQIEVKPSDLEEILSNKPFSMSKEEVKEIVERFEKKVLELSKEN